MIVIDLEYIQYYSSCVIENLCILTDEFHRITSTTQVALFSHCSKICVTNHRIDWNIYQGSQNLSSNTTEWILINNTQLYSNVWLFGILVTIR